jgi:hypothetical protein
LPKRKRKNQPDHSERMGPAVYQATIEKYRRIKELNDTHRNVNDVPIDNRKAQEELLSLMAETKPYRERANSLMGF